MNNEHQILFKLIYASVFNKTNNIDVKFNLSDMLSIAKRHSIINLLNYSIAHCDFEIKKEWSNLTEKKCYANVFLDAQQDFALEEIRKIFSESNIDFIPLKGIKLKKLYPSSDMRASSDIDIWIQSDQIPKAIRLLDLLGYELISDKHDIHISFKRNNILIELHKKLVTDETRGSKFCNSLWSRAVKVSNNEYELEKEDEYVYLLVHIAKHMIKGGIGIRHYVDIMLYLNKYNGVLNWEYINSILKQEGLFVFNENVKSLIDYWFFGGKQTEIILDLSDFIIHSGNYGTVSNYYTMKVAKSNYSKNQVLFRRLFPPYKHMKNLYPKLEKNRSLIVYYWFKRIFLSMGKIKSVGTEYKHISNVSDEQMKKITDFTKEIGLD